MTKLSTLSATLLSACLGFCALTAQAAPADSLIASLPACDATFFKAVAQNKAIPEAMKLHEGDRAYFKITHHPLDVIHFEKPLKDEGLTVTGVLFNDEIKRYFGLPDMHSHFWGVLVKEDFEKTLLKLRKDWADLDVNHSTASMKPVRRQNGHPAWEQFNMPEDRQMPDFGVTEKTFGVMRYGDETAIVCMMHSAGGPDEAILKDTRPDLLFGTPKVTITEPADDQNRPHVTAEGVNVKTGQMNKPEEKAEKPAAK